MIRIGIQPVERTNYKFTAPSHVQIPHASTAKDVILKSLLENPINTNILTGDTKLSIIVKVTIGGQDYNSCVPWASIDYDSFLSDANSPVILDFHLLRYVGDMDDYAFACPPPTKVLSRQINWRVFQNILYHEFAHLLDALNPKFRYDNSIKKGLRHEIRHILFQLWNAYIDRRLRAALGNTYAIVSPEGPTTLITSIWESNSDYTFAQLLQMANSCLE